MIPRILRAPVKTAAVCFALASTASIAAGAPCDGKWVLDLRTSEEVRPGAECGAAGFQLVQRRSGAGPFQR